jgi:hypothetical protein
MYRRGSFVLTSPSFAIFAISLVLALIALLMRYAGVNVPVLRASHAFDLLAIGYVLLTIGVLFRGI